MPTQVWSLLMCLFSPSHIWIQAYSKRQHSSFLRWKPAMGVHLLLLGCHDLSATIWISWFVQRPTEGLNWRLQLHSFRQFVPVWHCSWKERKFVGVDIFVKERSDADLIDLVKQLRLSIGRANKPWTALYIVLRRVTFRQLDTTEHGQEMGNRRIVFRVVICKTSGTTLNLFSWEIY